MSRQVKLGLEKIVSNCDEIGQQTTVCILGFENESVDSGCEWRGGGCTRMMTSAGVVQICGELEIDDDDDKSSAGIERAEKNLQYHVHQHWIDHCCTRTQAWPSILPDTKVYHRVPS